MLDAPTITGQPISDEMDPIDYGAADSLNNPIMMAAGTYASTDLTKTRTFLENCFGFECVRHKSDAMLVRDQGNQADGHRHGGEYWVIEVFERPEITHPQHVLNHWGADVATPEEVDQAYEIMSSHKDDWGVKLIQKPKNQHGSYAYYLRDFDDNWWEVQYHQGRTARFQEVGGFGPDALPRPHGDTPAIYAADMSHGTIEIAGNGNAARHFFAEFLGIGESPRVPGTPAFGFTTKRRWYVACIATGNSYHPQPVENRWVFALATAEEVDRFHDLAVEYQSLYRIQEISEVEEVDGGRTCRLRDVSGNWFEYQWRDRPIGRWYDSYFENGDRY